MAGAPKSLPRGIDLYRGRYRVRVYFEYRQVVVGSFDALSDAKAAQAIAKAEMARGVFVPPVIRRAQHRAKLEAEKIGSITVAACADEWLASLERAGRSGATLVSYRSILKTHLLPALGLMAISEVTSKHVSEALDAVAEGAPRRNAGRALSTLLNFAVKQDYIATSPFRYSIPKVEAHSGILDDDQVASREDVEKIAALMPPELALSVELAAWCALRLGEVMGLERQDFTALDEPSRAEVHIRRQVNVKAGEITPPKADSRRSLALPAFLLPRIQEHLSRYVAAEKEAPLFPGSGIGGRVSQSQLDRTWRTARDQVKPKMVFHSLRHTGLTYFARAGATLAELMARGGHRAIEVALRYQRATAERDRALTDLMSKQVEG